MQQPDGKSHNNKRQSLGVFGRNGSGKSSLTWEVIKRYRARGGAVMALDRQKQFGEYSVWPGLENLDPWLKNKVLGRFKGLLVLDDADIYMNSRSSQPWKDLIAANRHWNIDILVSSRAPQNIDVTLLGTLSVVCVFWTTSPHALKHLEKLLSEFPAAMQQIPQKPYDYLEVNFNTRTVAKRVTTQIG